MIGRDLYEGNGVIGDRVLEGRDFEKDVFSSGELLLELFENVDQLRVRVRRNRRY